MFHNGVVRGSGCALYECVFKQGDIDQMRRQAAIMRLYPAIYAPILTVAVDGYVMPLGHALKSRIQVENALLKLYDLWFPNKTLVGARGHIALRRRYQRYVETRPAPAKLHELLHRLWRRVEGIPGHCVAAVHGDPTLENIVVFKEGDARWIDPDPRLNLPLEAELDGGKLLQSYWGYEGAEYCFLVKEIEFFLFQKLKLNYDLLHYYLLTHLIRLWSHQPEKHSWVEHVLQEASWQ